MTCLMKIALRLTCLALGTSCLTRGALAQAVPASDAAPQSQPADSTLLGDVFSSPATGIELRGPAGAVKVSNGVPDQIVEFDVPDRKWVFKVSKADFSQSTPLIPSTGPDGLRKQGLLEITAAHLQMQNVAQVIAQDVIHLGEGGKTPAGLLVVRYSQGNERILLQEAMVQANDRLYYVLDMKSPGRADPENPADDLDEKRASQTFNQVLDSVRLLDRTAIYQDQVDRLMRTRALFLNWNSQFFRKHLQPEQYFRLLRNGMDIGYTIELQQYLDDKESRLANLPIVQVIVRSHTTPTADVTVDTKSTMVITDDHRHETWNNMELASDKNKGPKADVHLTETGVYDVKKIIVAPRQSPGEMLPNNKQDFEESDSASISVTRMTAHDSLKPFNHSPAVFYIPQALSHMLPALLPYKEQKKYLFQVYVAQGDSGQPALMMRYVDVLAPVQIMLDGRQVIAVPVADRIGLGGPVTTHYISNDDGRYLGSISKLTGADNTEVDIQILPTTLADIQHRWGAAQVPMPEGHAN